MPPPRAEAEPFDVGAELLDIGDGVGQHYDVRPVHPIAQLAMRVGLWSAVAVGAVGGAVGLLRAPVQHVEAVAEQADAGGAVPAPVAGTAELVVDAWLTATSADDDALDALFVDPPNTSDLRAGGLVVAALTTVSGEERASGYWAVTVAADVVETIPDDGGDGAAEAEPETVSSRWYLEVAIVGDVGGGLAALTTPAVVPGPPGVSTEWEASVEPLRSPGDGVLALTVEGFLGALLADGGDPSRYMAPGVEIDTLDTAPFVAVDLVKMSEDELDDGMTRVLAEVTATTPGGTRTRLTYELMLTEWADRWEIASFSGAPSIVVGPVRDAPVDAGT
jgi:hypothetical protein